MSKWKDIFTRDLVGVDFSEKKGVFILWFFIGIYTLFFSCISFLKYNSFGYFDYDLAYFDQIVWNILHGSIYNSILGMVFLGVHVQLIWFLLAPIYFIFPHPYTLLFLQSFALGFTAYPVYLLARKNLGYRWGLVISFMYLIYPAVNYLNLFELHATAFLPLFLLSMFYFFSEKRFGLFILFLFLAISCQENIFLAGLGMGVYALCLRRNIKWVVVPILLSCLYFIVCLKVIMPYFNNDTVQFKYLYSYLGDSPSKIFNNILKHPLGILAIMFIPLKLFYLLDLFGPLSFISFLSPVFLLTVSPLFLQHLLSRRLTQVSIQYHYIAELIPFIFIAFILGVKRLISLRFFAKVNRRTILAKFLILVSLIFAYVVGPWPQLRYFAVIDLIRDDYDVVKEEFLKKIPPDAPAVATFEFLSHMTHRKELYSFHHQYSGYYSLSTRPYNLPDTVQFALLDFNDYMTFGNFYEPQQYKNIQKFFGNGKWGVVDARDGIVLFQRDVKSRIPLYRVLETAPKPEHEMDFIVDGEIAFLGFDSFNVEPGFVHVSLYWKALRETQKDLSIFIDFDDKEGKVALRTVHPVCYWLYPTLAWKQGQWIKEDLYITIPNFVVSGSYDVKMGFIDRIKGLGYFVDPGDLLGRVSLGNVDINRAR